MIKKMAWNTFKNTGSIDAFLELVEMEKMQEVDGNGDCEDKRDNHCRKQ